VSNPTLSLKENQVADLSNDRLLERNLELHLMLESLAQAIADHQDLTKFPTDSDKSLYAKLQRVVEFK